MRKQVEQLSCQELVELVTDYLEDALPEEERLRFEDHISRCDGCNVYLEQIRETVAVLGRLTEDDLSTEAERALLDTFRDWHSG
jgi:anti-sigma factor RsiW